MKTSLKTVTTWVGIWLAATGCQTPGATRGAPFSASAQSGAFAQQDSSGGSNSDSGSGNSSDGSGNSSDGSGDSSGSSNNSSGSSDSSNNSSQKNPVASATVIALTAAGLGAVFWQAIAHAM